MNPHQRRRGLHVSHHQRHRVFCAFSELSLKSVDAELSPAGREGGRGDLSNRLRAHTIIIKCDTAITAEDRRTPASLRSPCPLRLRTSYEVIPQDPVHLQVKVLAPFQQMSPLSPFVLHSQLAQDIPRRRIIPKV